MAARYAGHYPSRSNKSVSKLSERARQQQTAIPTPPPEDYVKIFEACAATASYFLYAQGNLILSLHHETLAVDRRFTSHKDEVLLIAADNLSERGAGRLVVSYDASQTAIVWDLFTGNEVARFASYETIKVAAWMRDGSIAFGNSQGAIILFDVETSEHVNTRTIFDPVTALAPASDCRTFAIGYQNGSILVATLQPSFTILHTLNTSRAPSPICGLAWHGSSSRQVTDMLATQTADGLLRVWSVAKVPHQDQPRVIRVLESPGSGSTSRNWFAWSKNGRLISFGDNDVRAWDVRTKRVTNVQVPVADNVIAIANYGPNGNLFTVSQNHGVQQYDLVNQALPVMTKQVFHVPPNAPPTPPRSTETDSGIKIVPMRQARRLSTSSSIPSIPIQLDAESSGVDTSEDEGPMMSPLQRIAKEIDELEDERRDQLAPLSPVSSRASMSSASSYGRPRRHRQRSSSRSSQGSGGTVFSGGSSGQSGNDTMSIRTGTSLAPASASKQPSKLRYQTPRSPAESGGTTTKSTDLFPYLKAQLTEVQFRPPTYDHEEYSPDVLRREMLSCIFGWEEDIDDLIRDEQSRHPYGSPSSVLLSKWLGDTGADAMAQMVGSQSMSSSDWMLLALSSMGQGSQKQIGEAFVHRLLESDEVHPAVAILLGLGELHEAVEVYVSRKYYLEATLLACLCFPHDWQRMSHLVRKWGEILVSAGNPELAVRCFSCTSIECDEPWFSPRSQDLAFQAQQQLLTPEEPYASPISPPSAGSNRMTAKNASLKLITSFGAKGEPKPLAFGETPIADSATTPGNRRGGFKAFRDDSATRTVTPSGYRRNRMPSASRQPGMDSFPEGSDVPTRRATPAISEFSEEPETAVDLRKPTSRMGSRGTSSDRNKHGLSIETGSVTSRAGTAISVISGDTSMNSVISRGRHRRTESSYARQNDRDLDVPVNEEDPISPAQKTGDSLMSYKGRSIDRYISSLEEANSHANQLRSENRSRGASVDGRSKSRPRQREASAARSEFSIGRGRGSPTSPKSMTAEEAKPRLRDGDIEPLSARPRASSKLSASAGMRSESPQQKPGLRARSKAPSREVSRAPSGRATPEMPMMDAVQSRQRQSQVSPTTSEAPTRRERSSSRKPTPLNEQPMSARARSSSRKPFESFPGEFDQLEQSPEFGDRNKEGRHGRSLSRKEQAAKELEERRLSLSRRPSVPPIPEPGNFGRPRMSPRSVTDGELLSGKSFASGYDGPVSRSATVDPEAMSRYNIPKYGGSPTPIGLPATPKAMRNTRYDREDPDVPSMPAIPDEAGFTLAPITYQPEPGSPGGPLLPSTVYESPRPPLSRSASAPPEKMGMVYGSPIRASPGGNRLRKASQSRRGSNVDANGSPRESPRSSHVQQSRQHSGEYFTNTFLNPTDEHIVVVPEHPSEDLEPPVLAELAHLAGPPPPPPPPPMLAQSPPPPTMFPQAPPPPPSNDHMLTQTFTSLPISLTTRPGSAAQDRGLSPPPLTTSNLANLSRRNNSVSSISISATFDPVPPPIKEPQSAITSGTTNTSRWARVADRMRSSSRSRNAQSQHYREQGNGVISLNPTSLSALAYNDTKANANANASTTSFSTRSVSAGGEMLQTSTSPYETLLPTAFSRTKSPAAPYETVYDAPTLLGRRGSAPGHGQSQSQSLGPGPGPVPGPGPGTLSRQGSGGGGGGGGGIAGAQGREVSGRMRNPKDIVRANVPPPGGLQWGVES